jgi:hypothetical protein
MQQKTRWAWKIYFFIYSISILLSVLLLFSEGSPINQYYRILIAFTQSYSTQYYLYVAKVIVEALALIPLFLFAYGVRFLPSLVWQILLGARICLLLFGHAYEWNLLRSLMYSNSTRTIAVVLLAILFAVPSYIACIKYAFARKKLSQQI